MNLTNSFVSAFLDHLWQSSLFACGAWALALSLRNYRARTRYWLWLAASLKFLVPFSLLAALGTQFAKSTHTKAGLRAAVDEAIQPFAEMTVRNASTNFVPVSSTSSHTLVALLPSVLVFVWLCGLGGMLLFWWMQWHRISATMRDSQHLREGREIQVLRRLEKALDRCHALEILVSDNLMEPGIVGIIRPVLLWPAGISAHLEDKHLEAVLTHEICHVQNRDNLTSAVQMLVSATFWFHPLVWWIGAKLIEERERACDEEVVLQSEPKLYAESILKVCEFCVGQSPMCLAGITGADLKKRIGRILSDQVRGSLGRCGQSLLAAIALAAIAGPIAFGLIHGRIPLYGQILHASGPMPSYEWATIKPIQPGHGLPVVSGRPGVTSTGGSIKQLIGLAYNLPPLTTVQIVGAPDWVDKELYLVQAKIEDAMYANMKSQSPAQSTEQRLLLLQSLLADRMKLKVHFEKRELPMFAMVVAKGGPKLIPSKEIPLETDSLLPPPMAPGAAPSLAGLRKGFFAFRKGETFQMQAKGLTLDELAEMLQRQPDAGGRLIVNQTGIAGFFDCTMKWTPEPLGPSANEHGPSAESDEPLFFTAIREQIGLRLVPTKGPAEVIVIDHIERPSEN